MNIPFLIACRDGVRPSIASAIVSATRSGMSREELRATIRFLIQSWREGA
ncbi:MAG: hypothetical protein AB7E55_18740 [Pigmentiphaga sp.]